VRRLAAISLLLILFALTSGATTIACAANCARQPAAAPAMAMMHMHHHHVMPMPASTGFTATHCMGRALRLLAPRIVVSSTHSGSAPIAGKIHIELLAGASVVVQAPLASPPGPPLLPTQLRI
jgi:hypothetical protein